MRKGGRGKPPGAGAGGGGLSMETAFGSTTGITHGGPCAHVRAPRATCTGTHRRAHAIPARLGSHLMIDIMPQRRWGATESTSGIGCLRAGPREDKQAQGSPVPPAASHSQGAEVQSSTPGQSSCSPIMHRPRGNHKKRGPHPEGQRVSLSRERQRK